MTWEGEERRAAWEGDERRAPWAGEERREPNKVMASQLDSIKTALIDVTEAMVQLIPRSDVEDMVQTERRERYRVTMYLVGAMAILLAFVIFSVAQLSSLSSLARQNRLTLSKIDCAIRATTVQGTREQQSAAFAACAAIDANGEENE